MRQQARFENYRREAPRQDKTKPDPIPALAQLGVLISPSLNQHETVPIVCRLACRIAGAAQLQVLTGLPLGETGLTGGLQHGAQWLIAQRRNPTLRCGLVYACLRLSWRWRS